MFSSLSLGILILGKIARGMFCIIKSNYIVSCNTKVKVLLLTLIFTLEMKKLCTLYTLLGMFLTRQSVSGRGSSSFPVDITIYIMYTVYNT